VRVGRGPRGHKAGAKKKNKVETEVKLEVAGAAAARQAVESLGARRVRARHFEDNVLFDDAAGSLRSAGKTLRLRRTDEGTLLTFKGQRDLTHALKSRPEMEVTVGDFDAARAVLEGLGFRKVFRYQKYRETYTWRDVEIVVDETPLGTYIEIEGPTRSIRAATAALGRAPADYVLESYPGLFAASGRRGDMTFR